MVADSGPGELETNLAAVYAREVPSPETAVAVLTIAGQHIPQYFAREWFDLAWLFEQPA